MVRRSPGTIGGSGGGRMAVVLVPAAVAPALGVFPAPGGAMVAWVAVSGAPWCVLGVSGCVGGLRPESNISRRAPKLPQKSHGCATRAEAAWTPLKPPVGLPYCRVWGRNTPKRGQQRRSSALRRLTASTSSPGDFNSCQRPIKIPAVSASIDPLHADAATWPPIHRTLPATT